MRVKALSLLVSLVVALAVGCASTTRTAPPAAPPASPSLSGTAIVNIPAEQSAIVADETVPEERGEESYEDESSYAVPESYGNLRYFTNPCGENPSKSHRGYRAYRAVLDPVVQSGYGPCIDSKGRRIPHVGVRQSKARGRYHAGDIFMLPEGMRPGDIRVGEFQGIWRDNCGNDVIFLSLPKLVPVEARVALPPMSRQYAPQKSVQMEVRTDNPTNVGATSALLHGAVRMTGGAAPALCHFEIQDARTIGSLPEFSKDEVNDVGWAFYAPVTDLRGNTDYQYRSVCKTRGNAVAMGAWVPFRTQRTSWCATHTVACPVLQGVGISLLTYGLYKAYDNNHGHHGSTPSQTCSGYCTDGPYSQPPLWGGDPGGGMQPNPPPVWGGDPGGGTNQPNPPPPWNPNQPPPPTNNPPPPWGGG